MYNAGSNNNSRKLIIKIPHLKIKIPMKIMKYNKNVQRSDSVKLIFHLFKMVYKLKDHYFYFLTFS
jgi:hypothetical protein